MSKVAAGLSTLEIVQSLVEQVRQIELAPRPKAQRISSGSPQLDRILPDRGLSPGTLVEWLSAGPGSGATSLALQAAVQACRGGQALVVIDRQLPDRQNARQSNQQMFYLPGAASWGVDPARLVIVRPTSDTEEAWAIDQVLRCPAVGAMLCWPRRSDDHTYRRWQLAAEAGGTLGLLVRPLSARSQPSWAELRLSVEPISRSTRRINHGGTEETEGKKEIQGGPNTHPCVRVAQRQEDQDTPRFSTTGQSNLPVPAAPRHASVSGPPNPSRSHSLSSSPCLRGSNSPEPTYDQSLERRLRVQVVRCRWGKSGRSAEVTLGPNSSLQPIDTARTEARA